MNLWKKPPRSPITDHTSHSPEERMSHRPEWPWAWAESLVPSGQLQRLGRAGCKSEGLKVGGAAGRRGGTHVDEMVSVSNEQVAQDASFIEVPQADHVLHAVDRCGVHGLDVPGVLRGDPVFLRGGTVANVS